MSEWPRAALGSQTVKIGSGATPRGGEAVYQSHGVSLIRSQNVLDNAMRVDDIAHISDSAAESLRGVTVEPGDVLINITGDSVARCAVVDPSVLPARVNQHVAIVRPGPSLDSLFLQKLLVAPEMKAHLLTIATGGGTRNALTKSQLSGLDIPLPRLPEQQAIAEVLGALDNKIAANTTLVGRADELMRHTFLSLTSARETPLSSTAEFVNGRAFTKGASGTGRVVVRIAELNGGIGGSTVFSDAVVDDKHVARPGDILFAWSGSLTLHRWFREEAIVNQHIFKVIPREGHQAWLVYELLRQKLGDFKAIAADKATTMGHIQRHHLDEVVGIPSSNDIDSLNPLMSALWSSALSSERESLTLAATRDALLSNLMSGKLRVRDAEVAASEAGV